MHRVGSSIYNFKRYVAAPLNMFARDLLEKIVDQLIDLEGVMMVYNAILKRQTE